MTGPQWLTVARGEIGVHETTGPQATARIIEYGTATTLKPQSDEVPWCSDFANWCMSKAGVVGTRSAAAVSWLTWGMACGPIPGAITVVRTPTGGEHVGFWIGSDLGHTKLLGGNQGDQVKESLFPVEHYPVLGYRWPSQEQALIT